MIFCPTFRVSKSRIPHAPKLTWMLVRDWWQVFWIVIHPIANKICRSRIGSTKISHSCMGTDDFKIPARKLPSLLRLLQCPPENCIALARQLHVACIILKIELRYIDAVTKDKFLFNLHDSIVWFDCTCIHHTIWSIYRITMII